MPSIVLNAFLSLIEIIGVVQLQSSVVQKNCIRIPGADELQTFLKIINDRFQIKSINHENLESFATEYIIYQGSAEGKRDLRPQNCCKYPSLSLVWDCLAVFPVHFFPCFMVHRSTLGGVMPVSLTTQAALWSCQPTNCPLLVTMLLGCYEMQHKDTKKTFLPNKEAALATFMQWPTFSVCCTCFEKTPNV